MPESLVKLPGGRTGMSGRQWLLMLRIYPLSEQTPFKFELLRNPPTQRTNKTVWPLIRRNKRVSVWKPFAQYVKDFFLCLWTLTSDVNLVRFHKLLTSSFLLSGGAEFW